MKILRRFICIFIDHKWKAYRGYEDNPAFDTVCLRCGSRSESFEVWQTHNVKYK
jgi:hypothetical protein